MPATRRLEKKNRPLSGRAPLSRERIVSAALGLADSRGDFSMRALGQKLRVDPMAIYRHFQDKEHLLDAMVDEALAVIEAPDAGAPRERLRTMCLEFRRALAAHPGVALRVSTTRPTLGPHTVSLTEACLSLIGELGLAAPEASRAFMTLVRFVTGVSAADERVRAEGVSEAEWQEEMRAGYASLSPNLYPHVAAMADQVDRIGFQEEFEWGLDLFLDALVLRGSPPATTS